MKPSLRFEILRRDGYRCQYCGATARDGALHVDHVIPRALGGTDTPANLRTACQRCNIGKGVGSADPGGVRFEADLWDAKWEIELYDNDDALDFYEAIGEPGPLL